MRKIVCFLLLVCISLPVLAAWDPAFDHDGDGVIGLGDFALFVSHWLEEKPPEIVEPTGIEWVTINDDGSGMVDNDGITPISEGGFTGQMSKYEITNAVYCNWLNDALSRGLIVVDQGEVYRDDDYDQDRLLFRTYEDNGYSQISYASDQFTVRSRQGTVDTETIIYDMNDHPVVMVSWYGATEFCSFYGYRLPTQYEWQAVADYDGSYLYGCGTTIDPTKANYWNENPLELDSLPYTTPVGYYGEFGYGMADMSGNVAEWTNSDGWASSKVHRGRGFNSSGTYCTVFRNSDDAFKHTTDYDRGFRVCR